MKKIYTFTVSKEQEIEKEFSSKNEAGEEVITKKKVKELIPYTFFIKRPNRSLSDEASLYYAKEVSIGLKNGLMSAAMLRKRYVDDAGIYSEKEKEDIKNLQEKLEKLQKENEDLESVKNKDKKQEARAKEIDKEFADISTQLTNLMSYEQELFSNTAEYRARNKAVLYWIVFLSYQLNKDEEKPYFGTGSFDQRIEKYDELAESDDEFVKDIVSKFTYLVGIWATNNDISEEDLENALKLLEGNKDKDK